MNALLLAMGLSSCVSFAQWTEYYFLLAHRSEVSIPKAWMLDGMPKMAPAIEHAYSYPGDMSAGLVRAYALEHCDAQWVYDK